MEIGYCCDRHDHAGFLETCGRFGDFGLGKWLNTVRTVMGHPKNSFENSMVTQLKSFHRETILATDLEFLSYFVNNGSAFCPFPKNLPEAKLKNLRLILWLSFQDSLF